MSQPAQTSQPVNTPNESTAEVTAGSLITGVAVLTAAHYGVSADELATAAGTLFGIASAVGGLIHGVRAWRKRQS